ncbi:MAG: sigma-70 family RNA polymerase sigma factor [Holosporales bacterium]|jgi:RNA polymerase sigma factor (sigma-70 family)|nr:sigma-70 family RNA polymerase sigma factor [Holosporales bacterium]
MSSSTPEWFTKQEFAHIKARALSYAFKLKRRLFLQGESVQDLQQDLILAVIEAWKNFDRETKRMEPFVEEVLKYACMDIMRCQGRQKRQVAQFSTSLSDVPDNLLVDEEDNWVEEIEQKIDVERFLRKSPVFLRKVMGEIQNDSLQSVAQKLGISRARMRGLVNYCRQALAQRSS